MTPNSLPENGFFKWWRGTTHFFHLHMESRLDSRIYAFDEPMSGLHTSEKQIMIKEVNELRDLGNTVIVVEHDKEMIRHADHIYRDGS